MYPDCADKSILQAVARRRERSSRLSELAAERGETYQPEVAVPDQDQDLVSQPDEVLEIESIEGEVDTQLEEESVREVSTDYRSPSDESPLEVDSTEASVEVDEVEEVGEVEEELLGDKEASFAEPVYNIEEEKEDLASISTIIDFDVLPKSQPRRVNSKTAAMSDKLGKENVKPAKNSQNARTRAKDAAKSRPQSKKRESLLDNYFKDL